MTDRFVSFDNMRACVGDLFGEMRSAGLGIPPCYLVRDLYGKVRIAVAEGPEDDEARRRSLQYAAKNLHNRLGAHSYNPEDAVLFLDAATLADLGESALEVHPGVFWVDRLVTGSEWWTVDEPGPRRTPARFTLFSVKGGVGRSTTAAVLAWRLANQGERVLVADLDLESPGLSSALLDTKRQPQFGITDWFVEDLVGQGDVVIGDMSAEPAWAQDLEGEVRLAPAHGREPGDYLAKLGRVYLDTPGSWTLRLKSLLERLEDQYTPTVVLLESRSGLADIAAATVTDLDAEVLLFATDSESNWTDYDILFRHWRTQRLAEKVRGRLSFVSALTPEISAEDYLAKFREKAWKLFLDHLYDEVHPKTESGAEFSFDLNSEHAPHDPAVVLWTLGFAAGASLRNLEEAPVAKAYARFLSRFDQLLEGRRSERAP